MATYKELRDAVAARVPKAQMSKAAGAADAAEARWFDLNNLPKLGFHHEQIIEDWKKKHNKEDYL